MKGAHPAQGAALLDADITPRIALCPQDGLLGVVRNYVGSRMGPFSVWLADHGDARSGGTRNRVWGQTTVDALLSKPILGLGWPGVLRDRAAVVLAAVRLPSTQGPVEYKAIEKILLDELGKVESLMTLDKQHFCARTNIILLAFMDATKLQTKQKVPWKRYKMASSRSGQAVMTSAHNPTNVRGVYGSASTSHLSQAYNADDASQFTSQSQDNAPVQPQIPAITSSPLIKGIQPFVPDIITPSTPLRYITSQKSLLEEFSSQNENNMSSKSNDGTQQTIPGQESSANTYDKDQYKQNNQSESNGQYNPASNTATTNTVGQCQSVEDALNMFTKNYLKSQSIENYSGPSIKPSDILLIYDRIGDSTQDSASSSSSSSNLSSKLSSEQASDVSQVAKELETSCINLGCKCYDDLGNFYREKLKKALELLKNQFSSSEETKLTPEENKKCLSWVKRKLKIHYKIKTIYTDLLKVIMNPAPYQASVFLRPQLHSLLRLALTSEGGPYSSFIVRLREKIKLTNIISPSITLKKESIDMIRNIFQTIENEIRGLETVIESAEQPRPRSISFTTQADILSLKELTSKSSSNAISNITNNLLGVICPNGKSCEKNMSLINSANDMLSNFSPANNPTITPTYSQSPIQNQSIHVKCATEMKRTQQNIIYIFTQFGKLLHTQRPVDNADKSLIYSFYPEQYMEALLVYIGLAYIHLIVSEPMHRHITTLISLRKHICSILAEAGIELLSQQGELQKLIQKGQGRPELSFLAQRNIKEFNDLINKLKLKQSSRDPTLNLYNGCYKLLTLLDWAANEQYNSSSFTLIFFNACNVLKEIALQSLKILKSNEPVNHEAYLVSSIAISASTLNTLASLIHWSRDKTYEILGDLSKHRRLIYLTKQQEFTEWKKDDQSAAKKHHSHNNNNSHDNNQQQSTNMIAATSSGTCEIVDAFQVLYNPLLVKTKNHSYTRTEITLGSLSHMNNLKFLTVSGPCLVATAAGLFRQLFVILGPRTENNNKDNNNNNNNNNEVDNLDPVLLMCKKQPCNNSRGSVLICSPSLLSCISRQKEYEQNRTTLLPACLSSDDIALTGLKSSWGNECWSTIREATIETSSEFLSLLQSTEKCERLIVKLIQQYIAIDTKLIATDFKSGFMTISKTQRWAILENIMSMLTGIQYNYGGSNNNVNSNQNKENIKTTKDDNSILRELISFPTAALQCINPLISMIINNWDFIDTYLSNPDTKLCDIEILQNWLRTMSFGLLAVSPEEFISFYNLCNERNINLFSSNPININLYKFTDIFNVNIKFDNDKICWGDDVSITCQLGWKNVEYKLDIFKDLLKSERTFPQINFVINFHLIPISQKDKSEARIISILSDKIPLKDLIDGRIPEQIINKQLTINPIDYSESSFTKKLVLGNIDVCISPEDKNDTTLIYHINSSREALELNQSVNVDSATSKFSYHVKPLFVASTNVIPSLYGISITNNSKVRSPPSSISVIINMEKMLSDNMIQDYTSTLEGFALTKIDKEILGEENANKEGTILPIPFSISKCKLHEPQFYSKQTNKTQQKTITLFSVLIPLNPIEPGDKYDFCIILRNKLSSNLYSEFTLFIKAQSEDCETHIMPSEFRNDKTETSIHLIPSYISLSASNGGAGNSLFRETTSEKKVSYMKFRMILFYGQLQQSEFSRAILSGFNSQKYLTPRTYTSKKENIIDLQIPEALSSNIHLKNIPLNVSKNNTNSILAVNNLNSNRNSSSSSSSSNNNNNNNKESNMESITEEMKEYNAYKRDLSIFINSTKVPADEQYSILNIYHELNDVGTFSKIQDIKQNKELMLSTLFNTFICNNSNSARNKINIVISDGQDIDKLQEKIEPEREFWKECLLLCKTSYNITILAKETSKQLNGRREKTNINQKELLRLWAQLPTIGFVEKPVILSIHLMAVDCETYATEISLDIDCNSKDWMFTGITNISRIITYKEQKCDFILIPKHPGVLKIPDVQVTYKNIKPEKDNIHKEETKYISCRELQILGQNPI